MDYKGQLKRGATVSVLTTEGAVDRLVWEDCGDAVLVCSERQYEALSKGREAPMPIGFAKSNIKLVTT